MDNNEKNNRIAEALSLRNMKPVELCEKSGVKKSALSHWTSQHWQPKQKPLMAMARALQVSEMWLAGYDVPMERPKEQIKMDELAKLIHRLRQDEALKKLCLNVAELNNEQFSIINNMVNELLKINSQQS